MAEAQSNKGSSWASWLPVAVAFLMVPLAVAVVSGGASISSVPNALGAQTSQPINPTDPAVQALTDQLKVLGDPQAFVNANPNQLKQLKAAVENLRDGIKNKKGSLGSFPTADADKLDAIDKEIDTLASQINTDKTKAAATASQIISEIQALNLSSLATVNCSNGGHCLSVPSVIQGQGGYCARTSVAMALLFYSQSQVTGNQLVGYVHSLSDGRFTTAGSKGNIVSPTTMNAGTPHKDWEYSTALGSADAYYNAIKKSILGGDPVILYTLGAFFSNHSNHVVVAVGFNDANKTIYVNNPKTLGEGGTLVDSNRGQGGNTLTADFLYSHRGELFGGYHGHSLIIRKSYT